MIATSVIAVSILEIGIAVAVANKPTEYGSSVQVKKITRTIEMYQPQGLKTVVQKAYIKRTVKTNKKTGEKTYGKWSTSSWEKYVVVKVSGYTASKAVVDKTKVTNNTKNQIVKITYKADYPVDDEDMPESDYPVDDEDIPESELTKVPDVEGLYLSTAKKKLNNLGFTVEIQEAPSDEYLPGLVISQSIDADSMVDASKTTITLVVAVALEDQTESSSSSSSKKETFKLADLTGKSLEDAQSYAKSKKLNVKIKKDYSDSVDSGDVISTDPAPGSQISKGDTLTITVSNGIKQQE